MTIAFVVAERDYEVLPIYFFIFNHQDSFLRVKPILGQAVFARSLRNQSDTG